MLFMTDQGRVYRLKGYQVPEGSRTAKGTHIVNLLQLQEGEKVTLMLQQAADVDEDNTYATMVTKMGLIKRTPLSQFLGGRVGFAFVVDLDGLGLVVAVHAGYNGYLITLSQAHDTHTTAVTALSVDVSCMDADEE